MNFAVYFSWTVCVLLADYIIRHFFSVLPVFAIFLGQKDTETLEKRIMRLLKRFCEENFGCGTKPENREKKNGTKPKQDKTGKNGTKPEIVGQNRKSF